MLGVVALSDVDSSKSIRQVLAFCHVLLLLPCCDLNDMGSSTLPSSGVGVGRYRHLMAFDSNLQLVRVSPQKVETDPGWFVRRMTRGTVWMVLAKLQTLMNG